MRDFKSVDVSPYGKAFLMAGKYPLVFVGPLLASIVRFVILGAVPLGGSDGFSTVAASVYQLLGNFVSSLGLAFALIYADSAWRGQRSTMEQTWEVAQRRLGDIFFAMLGFGFVLYIAAIVGGMLGGFGSMALVLVAYFFFVYTLAAATIGGVPGSAALQSSLERARANPADTLIITIVYYVLSTMAGSFVRFTLLPIVMPDVNPYASEAAEVVTITLVDGYFAFVLAKVYANLAFGRRRW